MERDRLVGAFLVLASLVVCIAYAYVLFLTNERLALLFLKLTGLIAVWGVFGILGWIGYTLATTPPPKPIEELGKELEEELKKLEEEEKAEEGGGEEEKEG